MGYIPKISARLLLTLSAALLCAFLFGGCYTQMMAYQGEATQGRDNRGDECHDCRDQVPVSSSRREICVWERDIFGYPELRCYNTNYHSSWMYFHSTPWWYRSNFGWRDTRGCPPHYYYDRYAGICRLYGHTYPPANTGTGSSGGGSAGISRDERPGPVGRGISPGAAANEPRPTTSSASESAPMFGNTMRTLSPTGAPVQQQPPSSGSSDAGTLAKPQESPPPPPPPAQEQRPSNTDERPRPRPTSRGM